MTDAERLVQAVAVSPDSIERLFGYLDGIDTDDFREHGCVCKPGKPCYLHAHGIPAMRRTVKALLSERDAAEHLAEQRRIEGRRILDERNSFEATLIRYRNVEEAARGLLAIMESAPTADSESEWVALEDELRAALAALEEK